MTRMLGTLLTALLVVCGLAPSVQATASVPAAAAATYTYDTPVYDPPHTDCASERGPPTVDCVFVDYDAVDRRPRGASVCPKGPTTPATYDYDDLGRCVQTASRSGGVEGQVHSAAVGSLVVPRSDVAANTESRVLSKVDDLPCNCFVAGTKVKTACGEKPIEDVQIGDKVWARNLVTGKNELRTVTGLFHKHADQVMTITVADGAKVTVTEEHPFYVASLGWVMSGDLKIGDQLAQRNGGSTAITAIDVRVADTTVYNFEVAGDHNYFVTDAQLLVHNCPAGGYRSTPFDPDQQAVISLTKEASKRGTISRTEADTLYGWADEYGVPKIHGPQIDPFLPATNRWAGVEHVKINGIHIRVAE